MVKNEENKTNEKGFLCCWGSRNKDKNKGETQLKIVEENQIAEITTETTSASSNKNLEEEIEISGENSNNQETLRNNSQGLENNEVEVSEVISASDNEKKEVE